MTYGMISCFSGPLSDNLHLIKRLDRVNGVFTPSGHSLERWRSHIENSIHKASENTHGWYNPDVNQNWGYCLYLSWLYQRELQETFLIKYQENPPFLEQIKNIKLLDFVLFADVFITSAKSVQDFTKWQMNVKTEIFLPIALLKRYFHSLEPSFMSKSIPSRIRDATVTRVARSGNAIFSDQNLICLFH